MVNVPRLKGRENYSDWAFAVENFLVLEGLSKCITEVVPADDAKAKAKVILTIDASLFIHIKEAASTVELWEKLKSMFDDKGFARKISLLRCLISTRLDNCDSMASYVNQVVETSQKLRGTGFNINDEWVGSLLLAGLSEKFAPMIMAIEHSGIAITADSIKTKLLDMEIDSGSTGGAFASKSNWRDSRKVGLNQKTGNSDKKDIRCFKCKKLGHYQNKCPDIDKKNNSSHAFSAAFLNGTFRKSEWYVDSGASVHLCSNEELFEESRDPGEMREIMVANQEKVPVKCLGNVKLTTIVEQNTYDITVKNVLCVPNLTTNLLSVSQLIKNGNIVKFETNRCIIYNKQNEIIGTADLRNGVYKLNVFISDNILAGSAVVNDITWHRRFGHLNSEYLNKMKNGLVEGLNYQGLLKSSKNNCEVCCEGKQATLPFKHKGTRAKNILEIIHADVCGPMENRSIGGSKYFLILEDDFTRMAFVYFLKTKDQVFDYFKQFKVLVENQTGQKLKILRSDNGGEFCSGNFKKFLDHHGIIHQKTNPYTPQQNGMSERLNRTVVEKAKCLLFDASLPKKFWAEAVHTAVYLRNRSLASSLNKTPYEKWTGQKPNVSNLRIFGSPVMVHVPKEKRLKWDRKAVKCILMGYDDNIKGYRVYDKENNRIYTSRDVIVMESIDNDVSILVENEIDSSNEESVQVGEILENKINGEDDISSESSGEVWENCDSDESDSSLPSEETPVQLRRSERIPKPRQFDDNVIYFCSDDSDLSADPVSVQSALSRADGNKWKQAMDEELQSFEDNQAWELVDIPEKNTIVQCKWVFKRKNESDNSVRYRARLVAKGFSQKPGIDYDETFSPVVRHSTLRLLLALSVNLDLEITHLDVTTAFLNGILEEDVYMNLPEGFDTSNCKNKVLKLRKAIYGLKQSARAWNTRVNDCLKELNYRKSKLEPCVYVKSSGGCLTIVTVYVDDFFIFSNDKVETDVLKRELGQRFRLKDLGQLKHCLGMRVHIDKNKEFITLDQEQYIDNILKRFNMTDCRTVSTPMESKINLCKKENVCNTKLPYQQLIGSLMYLAVLTRPDIIFSVSYLSQFNNCFDESHWKQAKHVLRYLKKTKHYGLKFYKDKQNLHGFVDADWANDINDRRSFTGFCFIFSGSTVSWESKKQKTVALSSTEAEYMGLTEASKEAIYLRSLLNELIGFSNTVVLFNDSQSAQKLSVNPMFHKRSKHIDVRFHFIREAVAENLVQLKYLRTADMPADVLTKSLSSSKHYKCSENLGVIALT